MRRFAYGKLIAARTDSTSSRNSASSIERDPAASRLALLPLHPHPAGEELVHHPGVGPQVLGDPPGGELRLVSGGQGHGQRHLVGQVVLQEVLL
jgi:hypothetical protein